MNTRRCRARGPAARPAPARREKPRLRGAPGTCLPTDPFSVWLPSQLVVVQVFAPTGLPHSHWRPHFSRSQRSVVRALLPSSGTPNGYSGDHSRKALHYRLVRLKHSQSCLLNASLVFALLSASAQRSEPPLFIRGTSIYTDRVPYPNRSRFPKAIASSGRIHSAKLSRRFSVNCPAPPKSRPKTLASGCGARLPLAICSLTIRIA